MKRTCSRRPCSVTSIVSPSLTPPLCGTLAYSVVARAPAGAASGSASRAMRRGRRTVVQGRTWNSGQRCVLPIPMEMARRRHIALLALLVLPATAHAELGITTLPDDLAPSLAVSTVSGLATAPALPALPAVKRTVRYGTPAGNRMQGRSSRGVELHGLEGSDRIFGAAGPDQLFGETGPDALFGRGGADLLDG